jgi:hypothetical protein
MPSPPRPNICSCPAAAHSTSLAEFEFVLRTNLLSSFGMLRAAAKAMSRPANGGGSIALCSSAVACHGIANHEAIAAAKVAGQGWWRALWKVMCSAWEQGGGLYSRGPAGGVAELSRVCVPPEAGAGRTGATQEGSKLVL